MPLAEIAKTEDVPLADLYGWMGATADVADAVAKRFERLAAREGELDLGASLRARRAASGTAARGCAHVRAPWGG